ncbi:epoxyqueuosine reductase [Aminipila terrae]|uniref:Epoxyqueuosine reductase n=1 Tax=Aminipila terrae TaxID=2697030 RepID=A0A6P1MC20_9FIRM|nr:epoxyqueuosine reductase [Aminipila terrae]QHI71572.1 epoxyqueuosine reductase [Aminipila terrae]
MKEQIQRKAYSLGYEKCGIIPIRMMDGYHEKFQERMDKVPASKPFYQNQERLLHVQKEYPWAKSIIILAVKYSQYKVPDEVQQRIAKAYLFDNRMNFKSVEYQQSIAMEQYLQSLGLQVATNRRFGIVGLRWAAMQAGIGVVRKNNFFYTESGSWVHLEGFLVDREMEQIENTEIPSCPNGCMQCISACPTRALAAPYALQPMDCISFLTTFGGRNLPKEPLSEKFGLCIYGCDICQDVCPMNKGKWKGKEDFPGLSELAPLMRPENILNMSEELYREKVQPKFFYLSPEELWKWKVDVLCFMGNNDPQLYKHYILNALNDEHQRVRQMAESICDKLFKSNL